MMDVWPPARRQAIRLQSNIFIRLFNRANMLERPYPKIKMPSSAIPGAFENFRNRWPAGELYIPAPFIFAMSRLVVFIGIRLGGLLAPNPGSGHWDAGPFWYDKLLRWDEGLFAGIIRNGYANGADAGGSTTTGSFPLYPLLSYGVKSLLGVDEHVALLLVSNAASLATALLIAKFFKDGLGRETALLSAALFWFFPSSIFFLPAIRSRCSSRSFCSASSF